MDILVRNNSRNLIMNQGVGDCNNNERIYVGLTPMQEFYSGKNIFITGGTGFMGKMLIEKLLRSCPNLDNIYLLIRPKKGKDIHTRVEEIFDDAVFDTLRQLLPKFRHKIVALSGDCQIAGLGLKLQDRQTLCQHVDVVFHGAATVKFDEKLKLAIDINVHGTKDILELAQQMRNLKAMIHVSTAYANCNQEEIGEKFYDMPFKFEDLDRIVSKLDAAAVDDITPKVLGSWPNTYAFTKAVAEQIVQTRSGNLPIGVFRPAIVTSTSKEPVVGWIDNLYGPTGIVAGAGTGMLRTIHCDKDKNANIVPVDMTVNALLACAWDVAERQNSPIPQINLDQMNKSESIPVYNYVSSVENPLTWGEFCDLNIAKGFDYPFSNAIWYVSFFMNKSAMVNKIYQFFLHILPALLIDTVMVCAGQKPKLLKMYKKIHKFSQVLSFFSNNEWEFRNNNIQHLWKKLDDGDKSMFNFNLAELDWVEYLTWYIKGMRVHLFKDSLETIEASRSKWIRLYWLHQTTKLVLTGLVLYGVWNVLGAIFKI